MVVPTYTLGYRPTVTRMRRIVVFHLHYRRGARAGDHDLGGVGVSGHLH